MTISTWKERDNWIRQLLASEMPPIAKVVGTRLALYLNMETGRLDPTQFAIAKDTGTTDRNVRRGIAKLVARGWLAKTRRGSERSDFYRLKTPRPDESVQSECGRPDKTGKSDRTNPSSRKARRIRPVEKRIEKQIGIARKSAQIPPLTRLTAREEKKRKKPIPSLLLLAHFTELLIGYGKNTIADIWTIQSQHGKPSWLLARLAMTRKRSCVAPRPTWMARSLATARSWKIGWVGVVGPRRHQSRNRLQPVHSTRRQTQQGTCWPGRNVQRQTDLLERQQRNDPQETFNRIGSRKSNNGTGP
jgi:hypothetical protein